MENEWIKTSQYDAVRVSEYKGKYAIQKARRGEQKNFAEWVIPTRWDKDAGESIPTLKDGGDYLHVPLQVPLGEGRDRAADILKALYFQLIGKRMAEDESLETSKDMPPEPPIEDDVPF